MSLRDLYRRLHAVEAAQAPDPDPAQLPPLPANHPLFKNAPDLFGPPKPGQDDVDYLLEQSEHLAVWRGIVAAARQVQLRNARTIGSTTSTRTARTSHDL